MPASPASAHTCEETCACTTSSGYTRTPVTGWLILAKIQRAIRPNDSFLFSSRAWYHTSEQSVTYTQPRNFARFLSREFFPPQLLLKRSMTRYRDFLRIKNDQRWRSIALIDELKIISAEQLIKLFGNHG